MPIFKSLKFPSMTNIQFNNLGESYIEYNENYVISYNERSDRIYALKMMEFANPKSQTKFPLKKIRLNFQYIFYYLSP